MACSKTQIEDKYFSVPYMLILSTTNQYRVRNDEKKQKNVCFHHKRFSNGVIQINIEGTQSGENQLGMVLYKIFI